LRWAALRLVSAGCMGVLSALMMRVMTGQIAAAPMALTLTPGLGPRRILEAMRQVEAVNEIFSLPLTAIEGLKFPAAAAQYIFEGKARAGAEQEWNRACEHGVQIVTFGCSQYPGSLKEIYDPPPVLWVRGDAGLLARPSIAIVGTRPTSA
jgi:DNA processing protein